MSCVIRGLNSPLKILGQGLEATIVTISLQLHGMNGMMNLL